MADPRGDAAAGGGGQQPRGGTCRGERPEKRRRAGLARGARASAAPWSAGPQQVARAAVPFAARRGRIIQSIESDSSAGEEEASEPPQGASRGTGPSEPAPAPSSPLAHRTAGTRPQAPRGGRALRSAIREIIQQIRTDRCPLPSHPPKAKKTRVRPTWERLGASAFSTKEDAEKEIKGLEKGDSAFGEWTVASCDKKAKTFERSNQFTSEVQTVRYFLRR